MNSQSFNFSAIDGFANINTLVTGPSGSDAWALALSERNISVMSGAIAMGVALAGDLTILAAFPATAMTMALGLSGQVLGIVPIVSNPITSGLAVTGTINLRGGLSGEIDFFDNYTGTLTLTRPFGPQSIDFTWSESGTLARKLMLSGEIDAGLALDGNLSGLVRMGNQAIGLVFNATGDLALNATAQDADERTMVAGYVNRDMVAS